MNEIDTDWIDDMLAEDCPEYDDLTEETLSDNYSPEFQWNLSHCPQILQLM